MHYDGPTHDGLEYSPLLYKFPLQQQDAIYDSNT